LDWTVVHALNGALVSRDWPEDPITIGVAAMVPVFAAATVGLWLLARSEGEPIWKRCCISALLAAALALGANQVLAHFVWERPRPFTDHPGQVHLFAGASLDPSFPSDHAAAAFAIAVAVLLVSRRLGVAFLALAALISASRVVEGLHYPTDVMAGAAVGTLSALAVTYGARPVVDRLADGVSVVVDPLLDAAGRALAYATRRVK
jgi:undecaprenyl-diphosphatase